MTRLVNFAALQLLFITMVSCNWGKKNPGPVGHDQQILLVPFKGTDMGTLSELRKRLNTRVRAEIRIMPPVQLPVFAFYEKRKRYIADSLLVFLSKYSSGRHTKVVGIAGADISTRKAPHANYGIMGLAYCPGESCVISSFRVKRTSRSREHFLTRMTVLALHELGHTYSLPHCKNDPCLMRDAEGKMNLDNGENYCADCSFYLRKWGILQ